MKTPHEILTEFGCPDISFDENVTMYYPAIISAMHEYADQFKPKPQPEQPDIDTVINTVCNAYQIDPALIQIKTRRQEIVEPRQLIFALVMFGLRISCIKTGRQIGKLDHATVLHGIRMVSERFTTYKDYRVTVDYIIRSLWSDPDQQQYITDRIIDPHKDRRNVLSKFTHKTAQERF